MHYIKFIYLLLIIITINLIKKDDQMVGFLIGAANGKSLHEISSKICRWRDILAVPYREYLLSK